MTVISIDENPRFKKPAPARVVFADDDESLRHLLRTLFGLLPHVTVVGEAGDGAEAIRMVQQHYPDTVLLDADMPNLDGFAAAEVIRSFRPETRLLLHTAEPDAEKYRRAAALGLPLLDKLRMPDTAELVEEYAVLDDHALTTGVEPLIVLALAAHKKEGVIVVKPDETVPYYNPAIATLFGLPYPPEAMTVTELRVQLPALGADGSPYPVEEQPLVRALAERCPTSEIFYLRRADGMLRAYSIASQPFFEPDGSLMGVANYVTDLRGRGQAEAPLVGRSKPLARPLPALRAGE